MKTIEQIKQELHGMIALANSAGKGTWWVDENGWIMKNNTTSIHSVIDDVCIKKNDANFIACSRNMTPKVCKGLLLVIESIESILHYGHFVEKTDIEELKNTLYNICHEWE